MFVRVKKIGNHEYMYLVENAREGGRHVQRVIKVLGRRDAVEGSGMLDALVASAARHSRRSIVMWNLLPGRACGTAAVEYRTRPRVWSALAGKQVAAR